MMSNPSQTPGMIQRVLLRLSPHRVDPSRAQVNANQIADLSATTTRLDAATAAFPEPPLIGEYRKAAIRARRSRKGG